MVRPPPTGHGLQARTFTDDTKVHADASTFSSGVTKEEAYEQVLLQAEGLFYEQRNWVSFSGSMLCLSLGWLKWLLTWTVRCGMSCLLFPEKGSAG